MLNTSSYAPSPKALSFGGGGGGVNTSVSGSAFSMNHSFNNASFGASGLHAATPSALAIESALEIPCSEPTLAVEWSPFKDTSDLIAFGGDSKITVGQDNSDARRGPNLAFNHLVDLHHGTRLHALAWSPQSQLSPSVSLRLCAAGADFKVRLFDVAVQGESRAQVVALEGHTNYVNACTYSPSMEGTVLSTGDDRSCRMWDVRAQTETGSMQLSSPGMAVACHPSDPWKVMVAEKAGTVRFYDIRVLQPLFSMLTGAQPLMDADWCAADESQVGGIAGGMWQAWTLPYNGTQPDSGLAHAEGGRHFRWSRANPTLFATAGSGNGIKIHSTSRARVPAFGVQKGYVGGLSWHASLALCATGSDRCVRLWAADL